MSRITADEWVADQLDEIIIHARDNFYVDLITQEIPFWYKATLDGEKIDDSEVDWLINRRGFNEEESKSLRTLASFFNDNGLRIRQLWAYVEE